MARKPREKSSTGIYHVLVRAIADLSLFTDQEDADIYVSALNDLQDKGYCQIYAYAFYDTHLHLLLRDTTQCPISAEVGQERTTVGDVMKRLASTYSYYFNVKYDHYGPIYLDRFKSEPIEDRDTFLQCLNFVTCQQAEWKGILTNTIPSFGKKTLSAEDDAPRKRRTSFIDFRPREKRITDSRLMTFLQSEHHFTTPEEFIQRDDEDMTRTVASCKVVGGTVLQIVRLTGLTRKVVTRMTLQGTKKATAKRCAPLLT